MIVPIATGILTGVISSIAASYFFLAFYLKNKTPNIEISDYVCQEKGKDGNKTFAFKLVNKTKVPIYDVKIQCCFLTPIGSDGGQHLEAKYVNLNYDTYTHIPCESKGDSHALHAVQVVCKDDLLTMWENPSTFIRLQVIAKHELSGFSKVHVKNYHNRNNIKIGMFKFGNCLEIA